MPVSLWATPVQNSTDSLHSEAAWMKIGPWFSIRDLWLWVHQHQGLTGGHTILLVSSAYNIGLAKNFLPTFEYDVTEKPNGHFCQPCLPLRRVCGESAALLLIRFQHTQKGIWPIENRLNETAILVIHEYWLDHAFMFSLEWLSANYLVVNLSQKKIKLQDSNI